MYKIGDVFYLDKEYSAIAEHCNNNNLMIVEIEADEKGRRFQIQAVPEPTAVELALSEISKKKAILEKYKEDVEQVELFGMERADYEEKKEACRQLILELRKLEKNLTK
jgi:hypothetical protein